MTPSLIRPILFLGLLTMVGFFLFSPKISTQNKTGSPIPVASPTPPPPTATPTPTPKPTAKSTPKPAPTTYNKKAYLLIFNPNIGGQKLTDSQTWNNPDTLAQKYIQDVTEVSHNQISYTIALRDEVDAFPTKSDGFTYTSDSYKSCLASHDTCHNPDSVDYLSILNTYSVCQKLTAGQIDELWLFGGPWFGYWESVMAGPGAFSTNAPPITNWNCAKSIHIMGFNYERGPSEMLEDLGHRVEGTMPHVYGQWNRNGTSIWDKFTTIDKFSPNNAACGSVHYAPNSQTDYDWANLSSVTSTCEDWLNYPNLTGTTQTFNCSRWDCDGYKYKKWWLSHLPHASGTTEGKLNNWWSYVAQE